MDEAKQELADKLKDSNNILVTVSRDPSVDQLSALLGLTLLLNKLGKHAAAVFSGQVPSTLEFLEPEHTIEKNTDSLRDFIIALDKNKADKLRYKVEDDVVRIFITPYKTSISEADFEFSQGDFNVDVVVALGVKQQEDLDEAITAHGRILHDATVTSINASDEGGLGSINWHAPTASSLSELVTELVQMIADDELDEQIATALLTGVVSETDRFRNEKTTPQTMTLSAALMAAGANQQLVATKLEEEFDDPILHESDNDDEPHEDSGEIHPDDDPETPNDGTIAIDHEQHGEDAEANSDFALPAPGEPAGDEADQAPQTDEQPAETDQAAETPEITTMSQGSDLIIEPPTLGGVLTANSSEPLLEPTSDPLSTAPDQPLLSHDNETAVTSEDPAPSEPETPAAAEPATPLDPPIAPDPVAFTPPPPAWDASPEAMQGTLSDIEAAVEAAEPQSEADQPTDPPEHVDTARDEVSRAISEGFDPASPPTEPIQALNAQQFGGDLRADQPTDPQFTAPTPYFDPTAQTQAAQADSPDAPPPVPPPLPPAAYNQFGN